MKPIRLRLRGFLTYKNEIDIDFTRLYDKKIFVISGDTGSGKTSIFDAIQYALYGGVSRDIDPTRLRSDFLDATDPYTFVNLIFEVERKVYEIERIPAQLAKKTKEGQSLKNSATLYDITDERKILAEKLGDVEVEVNQIIGLDQKQFSKVMLLAQGEFQQFLQAKSTDRTKLLGDIFKTYEYKDIQEKIKDQAQDASKSMLAIDQRLENTAYRYYNVSKFIDRDALMVHDFEKIVGDMETLQKQGSDDLNNILAKESSLLAEERKLIASFEAGKSINQNIDKAKEIKKSLEEKLADKASFDELKEELARATYANSIEIYYDQYEDIKNKLERAKASLAELQNLSKALDLDFEKSEQAYENIPNLNEEVNKLRISYNENQKLLDELKEFKNIESQYKALEANSVTINQYQNELEDLTKNTEKLKIALEGKKDELNKKTSRKLEAKSNLLSLETKANNLAKDLVDAQKNKDNQEKIAANKNQIQALEKDKSALDEQITSFYKNQRLSEINKLRDELNDTGLCPVCGEIHNKKFEKFDVIDIDIDAITEKTIEIATAIKSKTALIKMLEESLVEVRSIDDLKNDIASVEKSYKAKSDEIEMLKAEIININISIRSSEIDLKDHLAGASQLQSKIIKLNEAAKDFEQIRLKYLANKERLGSLDIEILNNEVQTSRDKITDLTSSINNITETYNSLVNKKTELESRLASNMENISTYRSEKAKAKDNFEDKLKEYFDSFDEYSKYNELYPSIKLREEEIKDFYIELERLTTLSNNYKEFENIAYKDLDKIQNELGELTEKLKAIADEKSSTNLALANINQTIDELRDIEEAYKKIKSDAEVLSKLSKIADGSFAKVAGREKIDFETFVLTYYFDKVLAYANHRLYAMTGGQYKMVRNSQGADMRKKQGLDIEIFDVNTGKTRPSSTLSGGESFLASLALALGLSDEIAAENGGITIDTLFIDEGFGTLSDEYLNNVIEQIEKLSYENKFVGLISHVDELKEAIDAKILVTYTPEEGSFIKVDA